MHDNWPGVLGGGDTGLHSASLTGNERLALRKANVNFTTTVADGTSYTAPGGGLTTSGQCFFDTRNCDKIFSELDAWRRTLEVNQDEIRSALGMLPTDELAISAIFEGHGHGVKFYVPSRNTLLSIRLKA
jgi:hypothetical protein